MPDKEQSPSVTEAMIEAGEAMAHERTCYAVTRADLLWIYAAMSTAYPTPDLGEDEELVERTKRIADDTIEGPALVPTGDLRALLASIEALHAEREKLTRQLRDLAVALHAKHYAEVEQWRPLNDPIGILSQIDNMTTGLTRTALNASPKDSPDAP
jgi:hypothetical protein